MTFLDFGCVKRFEPLFIGDVQRLLRALVEHDRSAFDEYVLRLKLVLPGRPYNRELLWEFMRYQVEPVVEDREFTFTGAWLKKAGEVMRYENLQQLNLPADMLLFNRITFGLNAIFERLGASANFHRIIRRYLYPAEKLPPA